jgi:hypothetical protein
MRELSRMNRTSHVLQLRQPHPADMILAAAGAVAVPLAGRERTEAAVPEGQEERPGAPR